MEGLSQIKRVFEQAFGQVPATVAYAPGRVNLIGEHTDYNGGFVFPMAINCGTTVAVSPNHSNKLQVFAEQFAKDTKVLSMNHLPGKPKHNTDWLDYVIGTCQLLAEHMQKPLVGCHVAMWGNVPVGAGLSSSASLVMALLRALCELNRWPWDAVEMALLAQKIENDWVDVQCGIMDQLICGVGTDGHAMLMDCDRMTYEAVPMPEDVQVIVMDTATRHGLVDSLYNERRLSCQSAADLLGVKFLAEVSPQDLESAKVKLKGKVYQRAYHVVKEHARTVQAKNALINQDYQRLGQLLTESGVSLAKDFEVTNSALDKIVELALEHQACLGARMTGAGFGGCALALVRSKDQADFVNEVQAAYDQAMNLSSKFYCVRACRGAHII